MPLLQAVFLTACRGRRWKQKTYEYFRTRIVQILLSFSLSPTTGYCSGNLTESGPSSWDSEIPLMSKSVFSGGSSHGASVLLHSSTRNLPWCKYLSARMFTPVLFRMGERQDQRQRQREVRSKAGGMASWPRHWLDNTLECSHMMVWNEDD